MNIKQMLFDARQMCSFPAFKGSGPVDSYTFVLATAIAMSEMIRTAMRETDRSSGFPTTSNTNRHVQS